MTENALFGNAETLASARQSKFRATIDLVAERHPRYRAQLAELGLTASDLATPDDLAKLPLTTKDAFMAAPDLYRLDTTGLAPEMQAVWDVMHTTGTSTGTPTPVVNTTYDFFRILTLQKNMMAIRGITPEDSIANLFPLTVWPHGAFARALHAAAAMNIPIVSALPGRPADTFEEGHGLDEVVRIIERSGATILWGVTSYVRRVLIRAEEMGASFPNARLIFVTGEAAADAMRQDLTDRLSALGATDPWVSVSYGSTEMQGGMIECAPGSGFHNPVPDQMAVDIVDPDTHEPVPDGTPGLVVLSHLDRRGTVLLRYALGDISVRTRERCPNCGALTERLTQTPVRADNLVKVKGTLINPAAIEDALVALSGLTEFQVVVDRADAADPLSMDRMTVRASSHSDADIADEISKAVKDVSGITPDVDMTAADAIYAAGDSLKTKRFIDLRKAD